MFTIMNPGLEQPVVHELCQWNAGKGSRNGLVCGQLYGRATPYRFDLFAIHFYDGGFEHGAGNCELCFGSVGPPTGVVSPGLFLSHQQIREMLHFPKLTQEQEDLARKEHPWLFDETEDNMKEN